MDLQPVEYSLFSGEMSKVKKIWDETFQDPAPFTDYYFDNICKVNDIVVAMVNEKIIGMIHLNYYSVMYYGREVTAVYIVGVAVVPKYRRKGIMKGMMEYAFSYAKKKGVMFGFLMPKNRQYYLGIGFTHVYETKNIRLRIPKVLDYGKHFDPYTVCRLGMCDDAFFDVLALGINEALGKKYEIYCRRNPTYLKQMCLEHKCQNGDVCVLYDTSGDKIIIKGIFSYDVYGKTIYIDRYELFDDTFDIFFALLFDIGSKYGCEICNIMMPDDYYNSLFHNSKNQTVSWLAKNNLVEEITEGYGIMVKSLCDDSTENDICPERFFGQCFFDEIV
ncbi:MAG: GNAT family N-acetyltransferase [Lachnospiraceae bacterium]|nr:GNAT family N-acetyltransferase [Lachnospiraceae bacterium]